MGRASRFLDRVDKIVESVKVGKFLKLTSDVEEIPNKSVVEIIRVSKKGVKFEVDIESIDGSTATIEIDRDGKPHLLV